MPAASVCRGWLSNEVLPGGDLAVVWLERGTSTNRLQVGVPTAVHINDWIRGGLMEVMIGVDPHKASHYVFAVDDGEVELAQVSVRASREQVRRLLAWAEPFERGRGRSRDPTGWATCCRSSS